MTKEVKLHHSNQYRLQSLITNCINKHTNENNIASPVKTDTMPDRKDLNERKTPNKKTKRLYVKKKRNAGIL